MSLLFYCGGAILLLLVAAWVGATLFIYSRHRRYAHIPSPKMPSFYLGHLPVVMQRLKKEKHYHRLFLDWCEECGPLFVWFAIHFPIIIVMNPEDIKELLLNPKVSKSSVGYKPIINMLGERLMGRGLITLLDYNSWRPRRRLYDPFFTKSHLRILLPIFNECVDQFVERLRPKADGRTQMKLMDEFCYLTLNVISKAAFGSDFGQPWSDRQLGLKYTKGGGRLNFLIAHTLNGVPKPFINPLFQYLHPREVESYRETVRAIRMIGRDCIVKRMKALEDGETLPNDILTQILKITKHEEDTELEDLVDDFVTFFVAGQETTALLVSFALVELQWHPDILQRVLDEISEVLGERKMVTAEDLDQLKYMEMVLLETLRLFPIAPYTLREAPEGMKLSGLEIPEGTMFQIDFFSNHHNPQNFEDPETFDPNRFDPQREKPSPLIYHPFSTGHRACIGKTFALMEAKIILSRFLTAFKVCLPEGYKIEFALSSTLKFNDGLTCALEHI